MKLKIIFGILFISLIGVFYSFRILETPPGMTDDELSIGNNSALISETLRDENGRTLPFFVLSLGSDWKQPVSIYSTAIVFKLFGQSLFTLRLVNVFYFLLSLILIYILGESLIGSWGGIIAGIIFSTTPTILMHSHLGQENIVPVFFTLSWLLSLHLFQKHKNIRYLFLAGLALGIGLYSYKGMRAIVPIWSLLSIIFIYLNNNKSVIKNIFLFILGIAPFILIIPWLNTHYAGAVYTTDSVTPKNFYQFINSYLSSFDISYLFLIGDTEIRHSTGIHGMFLLSSLPLFFYGIYLSIRKSGFYLFLLLSFIFTPLLFGQVDSVHRFSRLLVFVPFAALFITLAMVNLKRNKILFASSSLLLLLNFADFVNYYWYTYPNKSQSSFVINTENSFKQLAKISKEKGLNPELSVYDYNTSIPAAKFFETAYFDTPIKIWTPGTELSPGSVLMTKLESQPNLTKLDIADQHFNFLINNTADN